ncbi:hypothetical protein JXB28_02500 [Candidatus Woesearchaeota archaeon]|nr:hypothetical protein [Candidatus Woesearchaeota archaeon]
MFTFMLVLLGVFLLCYSIFICKKMIESFTKSTYRRAGQIMLSLIIILFVGYIGYILFNYNLLFTDFIVGILLFMMAFFVTLVLHVNHSFIIRLTMQTLELKSFSEKLWEETQSLSSNKERLESIKSILEQKNNDLEMALRKVSARNLEAAKQMAVKELTKAFEPKSPSDDKVEDDKSKTGPGTKPE